MTVRVNQRNPKVHFVTLDKALFVVSHTMMLTSNEKVFDTKYKDIIGRMNNTATLIYHKCRVANQIKVRDSETRAMRFELQTDAIWHCEELITDIMISKKLFHLRTKKVVYWSKAVEECQAMIKKWHSSDLKRYGQ